MKQYKITILGSGTSTGIPMLGCPCDVCQSNDPKNKRLRTSILIETSNGKRILIDTTPDLRYQLLREDIQGLDAVIVTHEHADHLHGIDDLRPLCFGPPVREIPVYTHAKCAEHMKKTFPYIFDTEKVFTKDKPILGGGTPRLKLEVIQVGKKQKVCGEDFEFLLLPHGHTQTLAIIYKKFAYVIDCHVLSNQVLNDLKSRKLDFLIIDCVTDDRSHDSHLVMEQSFEYIARIEPKKAGLIHMNHNLDHAKLSAKASNKFSFPVSPLYDQEVILIKMLEK